MAVAAAGVVFEITPVNSVGSTWTMTESVSPAPVTVSFVRAGERASMMKACVDASGNVRVVSSVTFATVGSAEVTVTSTFTGLSCASRGVTSSDPVLPVSMNSFDGDRLSDAGPFRRSAVGSPLHAQAASAAPTRMTPMRRGFMFVIPRRIDEKLEAGDLLNRIVAQFRRPVGHAGFGAIASVQQGVVPESRHVHEHELEPPRPRVFPRLPGQVGPALGTLHHLVRLAVLDEDPAPIRSPPGHLRRAAFPKPHVCLVDPLVERGHLLVLGRSGCCISLTPEITKEPPLPVDREPAVDPELALVRQINQRLVQRVELRLAQPGEQIVRLLGRPRHGLDALLCLE